MLWIFKVHAMLAEISSREEDAMWSISGALK